MDLRQQFGITEEKRVRTVMSTMDQEWLIVNSNNLLSPKITTIIWGFHHQKANVIYELALLINSEKKFCGQQEFMTLTYFHKQENLRTFLKSRGYCQREKSLH